MAETIIFNIPPVQEGEDPAYEVLWYQSVDGEIWDSLPIDIEQVSNLITDPDTGLYSWTSGLAISSKWHQIRTRTVLGVEGLEGLTVPPRPITDPLNKESSILADRVWDGVEEYKIGEKVELLLNISNNSATVIGNTIDVHILDYFNNVLATLQANKLSDGLYIAEYIIPNNISKLYNPYDKEYNFEYFILKDRWLIPDSTGLEYSFKVSREFKEQAVTENSEYEILIKDVIDTDGLSAEETNIKFTSKLTPYYCDVEDVIDISLEDLGSIDRIQVAKSIISHSKNIDYTMKPDVIYYYDRYNNAVKNYLAYEIAYNILSKNLSITAESKELDTFKISKQYDYDKGLIKLIEEHLEKYGNIILAGGKDTPFTTKRFIKGIFDPNRPILNTAKIDLSDSYPYINKTISSAILHKENGEVIELRGYRTIGNINRYIHYNSHETIV